MSDGEYIHRIRTTLTSPAALDEAGAMLERASPFALVVVACTTDDPWWLRRACIEALDGRLLEEDTGALLERVMDTADVGEVRGAALRLLGAHWGAKDEGFASRRDALAWMRAQDLSAQAYGLSERIVEARARMGDTLVADDIAALVADPWTHRRQVGEGALAALRSAVGDAAVLERLRAESAGGLAVEGASAEVRLLGLRWLDEAPDAVAVPALVSALGDGETYVARHAAEALKERGAARLPDAALLTLCESVPATALAVTPPLAGDAARAAWAAVLLLWRGHEHAALPSVVANARVPLPVPDDVRRAVLRAHMDGPQRGTDPRMFIEHAAGGGQLWPGDPEHLEKALEALRSAGCDVGDVISVGWAHQQGAGTYHHVQVDGDLVFVCDVGPYVIGGEEDAIGANAADVLQRAGFTIVSSELANTVFEGLGVYYFGDRGPLTVRSLLFYWQD